MKAIQFDQYGPPEVLALVDVAEPRPRAGQIRIRVRAAGVNGLDGVTDVRVGEAVFGIGSNALAEHAVLDAWARMPEGLSSEEAAGYPIPVETAFRVLDQVGLRSGQTLLISGASGGVGTAVQQGALVSFQANGVPAALREAATLYAEGALRIPVQRTFTLADPAAAQAHNDAGHAAGRTVVTVPDPATQD